MTNITVSLFNCLKSTFLCVCEENVSILLFTIPFYSQNLQILMTKIVELICTHFSTLVLMFEKPLVVTLTF